MTRKLILPLSLTIALVAASPAAAYNYIYDCRGGVTWPNNTVTWYPSLTSFPVGSGWNNSVEAMRTAWDDNAPGTNYRIQYIWTPAPTSDNNDGHNSMLILSPSEWTARGYPSNRVAVTVTRRTMCWTWPGARADLAEADILFNPYISWDNSTNPSPPTSSGPVNSTIVGVHEHGHGFGLDHEDNLLATMNSAYPNAGVIGTRDDVHPHADDVKGDRNAYGTSYSAIDLDASAYRSTGYGGSDPIPAPASASRNGPVAFYFTVENRGTSNLSSVPVYFYLSPTRQVTTSSFYIGSVSVALDAGATLTGAAYLSVPLSAPIGYQYFGWIVDPYNLYAETDEGNNGVALTSPTYISGNNAPYACFTASTTSGNAPLSVGFNASCSSDNEGDPITFIWDFGDGTTGSGVTISHTFQRGTYTVTLTATDPLGASSTAFKTIRATCTGTCGAQ